MNQILYVTNRVLGNGVGGREQLSRLHGQILLQCFQDKFEQIELDGDAGYRKLFGYLDGVSPRSIDLVCKRIQEIGATQVFLDGSNLGRLAGAVKLALPYVEVLTFFHNCEARFFLGALRRSRSPKALGVLVANYFAERSAVRFSDKRICLSKRDSQLIRQIYGRAATDISAMAIQDRVPADQPGQHPENVAKYALFVGGAFYANKAGIKWFCEHVAPHISLRTCVVGNGMKALKNELERNGNVTVVGEVQNLSPWYRNAHVVVAPIFDGSGMKTKVAEALMYGKRIVGTPEAFSGYEAIASVVGEVCSSATETITALNLETERPYTEFDPTLRAIYDEHYSFRAASMRLHGILGSDSMLTTFNVSESRHG